jgi:type VI secretion system VasD/TssJ family lipoprotein
MSWIRLVSTLGVVALVTAPGCLCSKKAPEVQLGPIVRALCLEASPRLNWFDGRANTLYVRLYQLSTPDAFVQADAGRLLERDAVLPGAEGAPLERTVFPGRKEMVELRQQRDAAYLGVVAGYFKLQGRGKVHRPLPPPPPPDDDDEEQKRALSAGECIVFGPNGIEAP